MERRRKWGIGCAAALAVVGAGLGIAYAVVDRPVPDGKPGPEADALARRIREAVHQDAWDRTGAVRWVFAGRHRWLWDRKRDLARLRDGEQEVLLRLSDRSGRVTKGGEVLSGDERRDALDDAYASFINDAFWLQPMRTFFDAGVRRKLVQLDDGGSGLLVTYTQGGVTPGDSYLWIPGQDGKPVRWRMWVSIIPIGGLAASWERWRALETGALVSTLHRAGPVELEISDVHGAESLAALAPGPDPFAALRLPTGS